MIGHEIAIKSFDELFKSIDTFKSEISEKQGAIYEKIFFDKFLMMGCPLDDIPTPLYGLDNEGKRLVLAKVPKFNWAFSWHVHRFLRGRT